MLKADIAQLPAEIIAACTPTVAFDAPGVHCEYTCENEKGGNQQLYLIGTCTYADYTVEEVTANGGQVLVLNFEDGCSTSGIIRTILERES